MPEAQALLKPARTRERLAGADAGDGASASAWTKARVAQSAEEGAGTERAAGAAASAAPVRRSPSGRLSLLDGRSVTGPSSWSDRCGGEGMRASEEREGDDSSELQYNLILYNLV